jgi:DNA transformation protein
MPAKDKFVDYCIDLFAPLGRIDSRYMFGGWCLYCNGTVFALIADGAVYLKGDAKNIPQFEARGCKPFQPFPDKPGTMKYFQAPPEIFEDPDACQQWATGAINAGSRPYTARKLRRTPSAPRQKSPKAADQNAPAKSSRRPPK